MKLLKLRNGHIVDLDVTSTEYKHFHDSHIADRLGHPPDILQVMLLAQVQNDKHKWMCVLAVFEVHKVVTNREIANARRRLRNKCITELDALLKEQAAVPATL